MKSQSSYVPPPYIPLDRSEPEVETLPSSGDPAILQPISAGQTHWSSGICACFDDMQSCMLLSVLRP
ncbi:hypothetical protein NL676_001526 [Syzygium grande]|nr:hypothetical protein NL676_001526 [Syzygium grande]